MKKNLLSAIFVYIGLIANAQWNVVGTTCFSPGSIPAPQCFAVSKSGVPFVIFYDSNYNDSISVMKFDGTNWVYVGSPAIAAGYLGGGDTVPSLDLDPLGNPAFVFYDQTVNRLSVIKFNGSNWAYIGSPGLSAGNNALFSSFCFDNVGIPYVAFKDWDSSPGGLTIMKFNGSAWLTLGSPSGLYADWIKITTDNSGIPYVVFSEQSMSYKLSVMKFNGSSWVYVGSPGFTTSNAYYADIAIDSSGTPYVFGSGTSTPSVWKFSGSSWSNISSGIPGVQISYGSAGIKIPASGNLYIVFQDASTGYISVMQYDAATWSYIGAIQASVTQGSTSNIGIDSVGNPYIAYSDLGCTNTTTVRKFLMPIGVDEITEQNTVTIYPNPSTGQVSFDGVVENNLVEVMDITGRLIFSHTSYSNNPTIDLSNLDKGMYLYRITDEQNKIQQGKVILR